MGQSAARFSLPPTARWPRQVTSCVPCSPRTRPFPPPTPHRPSPICDWLTQAHIPGKRELCRVVTMEGAEGGSWGVISQVTAPRLLAQTVCPQQVVCAEHSVFSSGEFLFRTLREKLSSVSPLLCSPKSSVWGCPKHCTNLHQFPAGQ